MKQEFTFEIRKDGEKVTIGYRYGVREWFIAAIVASVWAFLLIEVIPSVIQR